MEDFYDNGTLLNSSFADSNNTYDEYDFHRMMSEYMYFAKVGFIAHVVTRVIICIGLPLTLVAIYAVYSLVRNDHVAPIYVINLLISDVIQLCALIFVEARIDWETLHIAYFIHNYGVAASVCFMVCIAVERYLVVSCPLWYRYKRSIRTSVVVCVLVWAFPLVWLLIFQFWVNFKVINVLISVFLLLPLPVFIFSLGGTLKALSASRVPSDEKRRIVAILVLVLLIYTLLFMPRIICFLADRDGYFDPFDILSFLFVKFSPLADLVLYVFMRAGIIDKLLAAVCCCRMDSNDANISTA
ncbi:mas-related G-protein coupled receptor member B5-like [Chaetodon auriga]|uniref:mas-related G-protein coupled receptor member B5-like n=1 Tax=Chaetodon auriga TaxID=39042 RepID=UPI004032BF65